MLWLEAFESLTCYHYVLVLMMAGEEFRSLQNFRDLPLSHAYLTIYFSSCSKTDEPYRRQTESDVIIHKVASHTRLHPPVCTLKPAVGGDFHGLRSQESNTKADAGFVVQVERRHLRHVALD